MLGNTAPCGLAGFGLAPAQAGLLTYAGKRCKLIRVSVTVSYGRSPDREGENLNGGGAAVQSSVPAGA
jgi:hypothetical protein